MGVLNEWAREMDEESKRVSNLIDEGHKFGETTFDVASNERELFHALVRHAKVVKRSGIAYVGQSGDDFQDPVLFFEIVGFKMADFSIRSDIDVDHEGKLSLFDDEGELGVEVEALFTNQELGIAYYFSMDLWDAFRNFEDEAFDLKDRTIKFYDTSETLFPVSKGFDI